MIESFPLLKQIPGSRSCLPTVVRAALLWQGVQASQAEVSAWCGETADGCWIDLAMEGLRAEGFDVEDLTGDEEGVRACLTDADDPQPVIVTRKIPADPLPVDHAVVLIGIEEREDEQGNREVIQFMDPLTGDIEEDRDGIFWVHWDCAGQRAMVIRS